MKTRTWMLLATVLTVMGGCYDSGNGDEDAADQQDAADDRVDLDVPPDTPIDVPADDMPADDTASDDTAADDPPTDEPTEDAPPVEHGDCRTSADCGGRACLRVPNEPGGYWVCADPTGEEATSCPEPEWDECCTSDECTDGADGGCFFSEDRSCGGPYMMPHNMCFYTQCEDDSACDFGLMCIEQGVFNLFRNTCAPATCRTEADCADRPGGYCRPFMNPCCPANIQGYYCVDPAVCEDDEDCGGYESCQPNYETGWGTCQMVACPA